MIRGGFPGGSVVKNPPANPGDTDSISGLGRSPEAENGNPLLYPCLGKPMDRGSLWATVHGVAKSRTWFSDKCAGAPWYGKNMESGRHGFQSVPFNIFMMSGKLFESESCWVMSDSLWPRGLYSPWNSPAQNNGVDNLSLLQGIFPTQGLNPGPALQVDS